MLCRNPPDQLYLALRASVAMTATVDDVDRFGGEVAPALEQSVLGISDRCLTAASTLEIEMLDGSAFTAVRVGDAEDLDDKSNVSCPEIGWHATRLFGERWASAP